MDISILSLLEQLSREERAALDCGGEDQLEAFFLLFLLHVLRTYPDGRVWERPDGVKTVLASLTAEERYSMVNPSPEQTRLICNEWRILKKDSRQSETSQVDLQPYEYHGLRESDEIRLIILLAGELDDIVRCRIIHSKLNGEPQYEALSYCWGKSLDISSVVIESGNQILEFEIKYDLYSALKSLRHRSTHRTLWVDAFCINQADNREKTSQVALMQQIYRGAEQVVIWLGEAYAFSNEAFEAISALYRVSQATKTEGNGVALRSLSEAQLSHFDPLWTAIVQLLNRRWFKRSWIVQEVSVSRRALILCGEKTLDWDVLVEVMDYLQKARAVCLYPLLNETGQFRLLEYQRQFFRMGGNHDVVLLLMHNTIAHATDPRDRVFAYHGLFTPGTPAQVMTVPDYDSDCVTVYKNLALSLLRETATLDILTITLPWQASRMRGLPTWVPDWSMAWLSSQPFLWQHIIPGFEVLHSQCKYRASGGTSYDLLVDGDRLGLQGWMFDTLLLLSEVKTCSHPPSRKLPRRKKIQQMLDEQRVLITWALVVATWGLNGRYQATNENVDEAYGKTLAAGDIYISPSTDAGLFTLHNWQSLPFAILQCLHLDRIWVMEICLGFIFVLRLLLTITGIKALYCLICRVFNIRHGLTFWPTTARTADDVLYSHTWYRRITRTSDGLMGLVPAQAEPGDMLVLCRGGKLPLLLRHVRGNRESFEFIGECYVHGVMDGSLWEYLDTTGQDKHEIGPEGSVIDGMKAHSIRQTSETVNGIQERTDNAKSPLQRPERRTFWLV